MLIQRFVFSYIKITVEIHIDLSIESFPNHSHLAKGRLYSLIARRGLFGGNADTALTV